MAIPPIDLQNIFASMPEVSKKQALEENSSTQKQSRSASLIQDKQEEDSSVNKIEEDQDVSSVRDKREEGPLYDETAPQTKHKTEKKEPRKESFSDPNVGKHIDISG